MVSANCCADYNATASQSNRSVEPFQNYKRVLTLLRFSARYVNFAHVSVSKTVRRVFVCAARMQLHNDAVFAEICHLLDDVDAPQVKRKLFMATEDFHRRSLDLQRANAGEDGRANNSSCCGTASSEPKQVCNVVAEVASLPATSLGVEMQMDCLDLPKMAIQLEDDSLVDQFFNISVAADNLGCHKGVQTASAVEFIVGDSQIKSLINSNVETSFCTSPSSPPQQSRTRHSHQLTYGRFVCNGEMQQFYCAAEDDEIDGKDDIVPCPNKSLESSKVCDQIMPPVLPNSEASAGLCCSSSYCAANDSVCSQNDSCSTEDLSGMTFSLLRPEEEDKVCFKTEVASTPHDSPQHSSGMSNWIRKTRNEL